MSTELSPSIHVRVAEFFRTDTFKLLLFLFLIALLLRVVGINYGYLHGDERINSAAKVLSGQFIPDQHFYPPLFNYINAVFFAALYAVGRMIPLWYDIEGFRAAYFSTPEIFYFTARFVTALSAAMVAPLFFIAARLAGSSRTGSIAAAILGATLPIGVYLSHIAKSDVPLATAAVLTLVLLQLKYLRPQDRLLDCLIGFTLALGFSFKQSFIFIAVPLALFHLFYAWRYRPEILKLTTVARIGGVFLAALVVLNLAIILDWQTFLTYQAIQSQMSVRSLGNVFASFWSWAEFAASTSRGTTFLSVAAFAAFPFLFLRKGWMPDAALPLVPSWAAIASGTMLVIVITGGRQQEGLWIPFFTAMHLFSAVIIACLIDCGRTRAGIAGRTGFVLILMLSVAGIGRIWTEAQAQPLSIDLAHIVSENYLDRKILTSTLIDLPQRREAQQMEVARDRHLAEKYKVELPELSPEKIITVSAPGAVYYVKRPVVMFGLENADDTAMEGIVQAHAWPLQGPEWKLDYWLERDFDVFVISSLDYELHEVNSQIMRGFAKELVERCEIARKLEARKPLFLETDVTILDCAGARR